MNVKYPHTWWSTLSLKLLVRVRHCHCLLVAVVDWFSTRLETLFCCEFTLTPRSAMSLLFYCLIYIGLLVLPPLSFKLCDVRRIMLDLNSHGCNDPFCILNFFLKRTADVLDPRLSLELWHLLCLGNFSTCWRQTNVTLIPKVPCSTLVPIADRFP